MFVGRLDSALDNENNPGVKTFTPRLDNIAYVQKTKDVCW